MSNEEEIASWERLYYTKGEQRPELFYIIYGDLDEGSFKISPSKHRTECIPEGINLYLHKNTEIDTLKWPFIDDPIRSIIYDSNPQLFDKAKSSKSCITIRGKVQNYSTLNYLRDIVGLIMALFENGAVAVFDPCTLSLWSKNDWQNSLYDTQNTKLENHIAFIGSLENEKIWLHTRGMIKFGRRDISIPDVELAQKDAMLGLAKKYVKKQIDGEIIQHRQLIKLIGKEGFLKCYNKGSMDDPDFNNFHIEIK